MHTITEFKSFSVIGGVLISNVLNLYSMHPGKIYNGTVYTTKMMKKGKIVLPSAANKQQYLYFAFFLNYCCVDCVIIYLL
jgi:hypothetical protein